MLLKLLKVTCSIDALIRLSFASKHVSLRNVHQMVYFLDITQWPDGAAEDGGVPDSQWQEVMDGRDYRIAATWAVSFNAGGATVGSRTVYLWMVSTWPNRPAMALLQVGRVRFRVRVRVESGSGQSRS